MKLSRRRLLLAPLALGALALERNTLAAKPGRIAPPSAEARRNQAIERGLRFVYATALVPRNFAEHGDDFLWCFHTISATAADPKLAALARRMGEERARAWRRLNPRVPADAEADHVEALIFGSHAADLLGVPGPGMREELQRAAGRFGAVDFLHFDPAREPPPDDVPDACSRCRSDNARGRRRCTTCGGPLAMKSAYDLLCDALISTYSGDRYGVPLGATYADVAALIPRLRPYRGYDNGSNPAFMETAYAVTHVVYTMNDYGTYRLKPEWLPQEFDFLLANFGVSIELDDPETMGEFVDSLKAFGMTEQDPAIAAGIEFLLETQQRDGSWGGRAEKDAYARYHPAWTAVDGLRDYAFARGEGVSFPEALERARG
jgi:hypothetical protein